METTRKTSSDPEGQLIGCLIIIGLLVILAAMGVVGAWVFLGPGAI